MPCPRPGSPSRLETQLRPIDQWGRNKYQYFTNSLGFRDERIREVPRADPSADTDPWRFLHGGPDRVAGQLCRSNRCPLSPIRIPQRRRGRLLSIQLPQCGTEVLAKGVEIDEAIVFIGIQDVQFEAAFYRDIDASGAVTGPERVTLGLPMYTWDPLRTRALPAHRLSLESSSGFWSVTAITTSQEP